MKVYDAKTIDDYRNACRQSLEFSQANGLRPSSAHEELAGIVLQSLAETGSAALFAEVEEEVRNLILRALRHYRRLGQRELCYPHAGRYRDGRQEARAAIATLVAAKLVPESMTHIAAPIPKFMGLELIQGIASLGERIACDDALLDVELVALAQDVPNPRAYPQRWTMSLLITEHERCDIDDRFYARVATRSCVATFALHGNVSMHFWPRFSFDYVFRFRVTQEPRNRSKMVIKVKLDMGGKGRLYCRNMELLRLEEINCVSVV